MRKKQRKRADPDTFRTGGYCDLDAGADRPDAMSLHDSTPGTIATLFRSSRYTQILAGFTIIGFFLRFLHLGENSLWLDEASTLTFARRSLMGIWETTVSGEFNPPLFYWLEHCMLVFGESEFVLRFIPALLGASTIPVFYLIGKEFKDKNTGVIAAALLTFSPFHLFYSQDARAYAPMLFFVSLALLFYLRALRSGEVRSWALFGIFSALAFWTHFYAFVPIVVLLLHALLVSAETIRKDVKAAVPLLSGFLVFTGISLPLIIVAARLFLIRTASAPTFGVQGLNLVYQTLLQISGFNEFVLILFFMLFVLGVLVTWRGDRNGALLLILMLVLPMAVSIVLSSRMPMVPRYLIYLLPFYFIGIASSYSGLYAIFRSKNVVYLFVIGIMLLSLPYFASYYTSYQKNDWRGFASDLSNKTSEGDIVVVMPPYMQQPLDYYYRNTTDQTLELGATTALELQAIRDRYPAQKTFYVVTGDIMAANPEGDGLAWIQEHTQFLERNMGIYLFVSA